MASTGKRIVFMGTPEFAVASLDALIQAGIEVAGVVTAPDKPAGRGKQLRQSAVKEYAAAHSLPVLQPWKLRDTEFLGQLDQLNGALYVVVAFRMLPEVVWNRPRLGTINLHASLLPAYRGAAPINWAIIRGERRTGATTFFIRQEIDTGDIIDSDTIEIGPEENAGSLHDRLARTGAQLLVKTVRSILDGTCSSKPQADAVEGMPAAPKLTPENCRIDWSRSAQAVHDLIRGLSPWPGAWTTLIRPSKNTVQFKVLDSRIVGGRNASLQPGTIECNDGQLLIACADGWIRAMDVQMEGKRRMSADDFLRGSGDLAGAQLQ